MKPILTCVCLLMMVCPGFAQDKPPNVVTLLVDDLGYRDLGCYGGPVKTPVLDKLAAGGVRFTDFHSGAATCCPSRATFLTGRHHYRSGVYSVITERLHKMHLLESETTIAEDQDFQESDEGTTDYSNRVSTNAGFNRGGCWRTSRRFMEIHSARALGICIENRRAYARFMGHTANNPPSLAGRPASSSSNSSFNAEE